MPPARDCVPGRWVATPVEGKGAGNTSGRVKVDDDGRAGVAWNHVTGQHVRFRVDGSTGGVTGAPRARDMAAGRRRAEEREEVARACERIVKACAQTEHPYLAAKGFPAEIGLVIDDPRPHLPAGNLGDAMARALPETDGPLLVVPGRIAHRIVTVQFITPAGDKKNALKGTMGGAHHRISTGNETWVAEGIATALTIRAALRFLGRQATVLAAFSAQNVAKVAGMAHGSTIAADYDRPLDQLHGLGTGEHWARSSGRPWVMPPALGDFNDMHQSEGLREVAMALRDVRPP